MGNTTTKTDKLMSEWTKKVDEAHAKLDRLRTELDDAELAVVSIEGSWKSGDDTATAEDYTRAQAEVTRVRSLLSAAEREAGRLTSARPSDLRMAESLVEPLSEIFEIEATATRTDNGGELVVMPHGEVGYRDGVASGKVLVRRGSAPLSLGIDGEALEAALKAQGIFSVVESLRPVNGRESASVDVLAWAPAGLPVLPVAPDREIFEAMAESALKTGEGRARAPREHGGRDMGVELARDDTGRITAQNIGVRTTTEKRDGQLIRKTVVTAAPQLVGAYVSQLDERTSRATVAMLAVDWLGKDLGRPMPGVGTIVEADTNGGMGLRFAVESIEGEVA